MHSLSLAESRPLTRQVSRFCTFQYVNSMFSPGYEEACLRFEIENVLSNVVSNAM